MMSGLIRNTVLILSALATGSALAMTDSEYFSERVGLGELPPLEERLPREPALVQTGEDFRPGRHGGRLRLLFGRAKDIRMLMVYGYARLVGYDRDLQLRPDILRDLEVEDGRIFTLHLREGHRWSDGAPFDAEAFRYYWEDIVGNRELYPFGLPDALTVDGKSARFEVIGPRTIRYTWHAPNPFFLPALAGPRPLFIYAPAHYLKQFHADYADAGELARKVEEAGTRNWAGLHHRRNHPYKNDNPDLPVLQPWVNTTRMPSERFVFERNPFYHRVDENGLQLPYIDEVVVQVTSANLVSAKTASGESDLQGRHLNLDDYTFLKAGEKRGRYRVRLWQNGYGSQFAIYPNLNSKDPVWRELVRQRDFRRALSLGINRHEINQVIYFGLAQATGNTVLPGCALFREDYASRWNEYDPEHANRLLDSLGLAGRDKRGIRLLPDGRPLEIVLHTAGEGTQETDILELIGESWLGIGIKLHTKPSQREVFRERVFSGGAMMAMFNGIDNGLPTADMSPGEFAPTSQTQYQWPKWGQYFETNQSTGEPPDIAEAGELLALFHRWGRSGNRREREEIWHRMLDIYSDEVFSIGLIRGVPQPVVVSNALMNVPETGIYSWMPTAFFGVYRPDTFWFQ